MSYIQYRKCLNVLLLQTNKNLGLNKLLMMQKKTIYDDTKKKSNQVSENLVLNISNFQSIQCYLTFAVLLMILANRIFFSLFIISLRHVSTFYLSPWRSLHHPHIQPVTTSSIPLLSIIIIIIIMATSQNYFYFTTSTFRSSYTL